MAEHHPCVRNGSRKFQFVPMTWAARQRSRSGIINTSSRGDAVKPRASTLRGFRYKSPDFVSGRIDRIFRMELTIGLHRRLVSLEITMPALPFPAVCQCDGAERGEVVTSVSHGTSLRRRGTSVPVGPPDHFQHPINTVNGRARS